MRKSHLMIIAALFCAVTAFAGQTQPLSPRTASRAGSPDPLENTKRASVAKVIPHLAASNDWKSTIIFRNDLLTEITLNIDFYGFDGLPASAVFRDSDGSLFESDRIDVTLDALEIYTIEFDQMSDSGLFNLTAFVFSDETETEYTLETVFSNFQGSQKVASVGGDVPLQIGQNFFMNVDERNDFFTGNQKLRGLAVTNTSVNTCDCTVTMWDHLSAQTAVEEIQIDPSAKWLGTVGSLISTSGLAKGLGLLDLRCSELIAVTGLSFETGTPIVGSTPIYYYEDSTNKRASGTR